MGDYHPFILKARSALIGGTKAKDHLHGLAPGVSPQFIEGVLERLAAAGNSDRPVAARFQTHPENVRRLIDDEFSLASQAAMRGVVYQLTERPHQSRRPRPLRLQEGQRVAAPRPSSGHAGSPFGKTGVAHEVFSGRIWYVRTLISVPGCGERATIGLKKSDASRRNRVTLIFFL